MLGSCNVNVSPSPTVPISHSPNLPNPNLRFRAQISSSLFPSLCAIMPNEERDLLETDGEARQELRAETRNRRQIIAKEPIDGFVY